MPVATKGDHGFGGACFHHRTVLRASHTIGLGVFKPLLLYVLTALMELLGCYLPYLWLRQGRSSLVLIPTALCLGLFVWLLSLHPTASGRVYAAYGAVYVSMALLWLWLVDGVVPTSRDLLGVAVVLAGLGVLLGGGAQRP